MQHSSTPPPGGRTLPGRGTRRLSRRRRHNRRGGLTLQRDGDDAGLLRGGGRVPVEEHLGGEDGIEDEAGDEAVEDELVVYFLEGGEDAGEGSEEVVEDLEKEIAVSQVLYSPSSLSFLNGRIV